MALYRRSSSLPPVPKRPLFQRSDSDMSSVLQTRAPPEDRLPIFTGRKAWERWINLSPSTRAQIEEGGEYDHSTDDSDEFGTKYSSLGDNPLLHNQCFVDELDNFSALMEVNVQSLC